MVNQFPALFAYPEAVRKRPKGVNLNGDEKMLNAFRKLWNNDRGNVLIIAGAALPLLVGSAGIATDTIQWTLWKRQLQRAADSAAIAGAYQRNQAGQDNQAAVEGAVNNDLNPAATRMTFDERTGLSLLGGGPDVDLIPDDPDDDARRQVRVTLAIRKELTFSSMFMSSPPVIRATATAAAVPGGDEYCVIGLDPRPVTGLEIGGATELDMGDCSLITNATHATQAATNIGNAPKNVKAKTLAAQGGVTASKNWNIENYEPASSPITDPFGPEGERPLPIPPKEDCHKTITVSNKAQDYPLTVSVPAVPSGKVTCITGGLDIAGELNFAPGTYVIDGGNLSMNSTGSSLNCTGCTFILTNSANPAQTGNIRLTGGTVNITAPTAEGTYRGIALYQDRRATDDGKAGQNHVNGNSSTGVTGVIYTPSRSLLYNGGGGLTSMCMQVIAQRVRFSGSSNIKVSNECAGEGLDVISGGFKIRLIA